MRLIADMVYRNWEPRFIRNATSDLEGVLVEHRAYCESEEEQVLLTPESSDRLLLTGNMRQLP